MAKNFLPPPRHQDTKKNLKNSLVPWWQSIFNNVSFEIELIVYKGKNNKSIWQKNPPFRANRKGGFLLQLCLSPARRREGVLLWVNDDYPM